MSSALDEDTRRTLDRGRETAGAMLRAAQKDLQKVFIVFLVGFLGTFYALRLYIWDFFKGVTEAKMNALTAESVEIIAQTPFDVILLQAKIGLVVGVIFAVPPFLYFSRDALRARDLWPSSPVPVWKLVVLLLAMTVLFMLGVAYGYLVFFPFTFAFLANNAISAGFAPTYSIVKWAQFIFLLTISFGFATQLPLVMTALSYTEIVPYETFKEKWRHAIAGIFLAGALFTPPDPFTQVLWATPVIVLYGFSLYLARVVTTARRGSDRLDLPRTLRTRWNLLAGAAVLGGLALYAFFSYGGVPLANDLLASAGSDYRAITPGRTLLFVYVAAAGLTGGVLAAMYVVYVDIVALAGSATPGTVGDPADIDLRELDAMGVRAAPPEAFAELEEQEALRLSSEAMEAGDKEKARAILDRFDAAEAEREARAHEDGEEPDPVEDVTDRTERATGTFLSELTEGEKDEDDVGGYYDEIAFVVDSVTSKSFRIAAVFGITLASVFGWLYTGGIGEVFEQFLSQLPAQVTPDQDITVVALHPMEALIFEVKFSTLIAALVTLPVIAYYAWPALRERNVVRHRRRAVFGWAGALTAGLLGGFALGYGYVAPTIISFLVADAVQSNMIIAYRITNFFWLIFFTTAGIGLLADVPVLMVLLNTAGVSYRTMRSRWREVTVGILSFAALFTPADVITMFLVTVPLMAAYGAGLGILYVITLGGRRNLAKPRTAEA
ncbi:twin-arginine translocase subunit TatC [Salinigranum salinum]|uniref:twin-arginine translocase subunit TatC n=1 Tax=Salinigranum salinum TaxID=1364937 RepID=UPI001260F64A|nr:twin-arginine translocase subunit TatC [Salinigranum salinum]